MAIRSPASRKIEVERKSTHHGWRSKFVFSAKVDTPTGTGTEAFEWKPSKGAAVRRLDDAEKRGYKLVRVATGEVVAVMARTSAGGTRFVFYQRLGIPWELAAVVSGFASKLKQEKKGSQNSSMLGGASTALS